MSYHNRRKKRRNSLRYWAGAGVIVLLVAVGAYFLMRKVPTSSREAAQSTITPSSVSGTSAVISPESSTDADSKTSPTPEPEPSPTIDPAYELHQSKTIAIDAGHQLHQNSDTEPVGPGASEKKMKVSSGTSGCVTGLNEYELNLQVAKRLKKALKKEGYQVIMIREKNEVDISNRERAEIANEQNADAFIRIHADGSDNSADQGAMTICPTKNSPYCPQIYKKSKKLSRCILQGVVRKTGCRQRDIWETDTMSGINWCEVPVTILEMGFMSNPEEDRLMASKAYQKKIVKGIVNGMNEFFG